MEGINRSGRGFNKTRKPSKCWGAVRDKAGVGKWLGASLIAQVVKNLPAMQETLVPFLSQEDPLEKREATHPSILGWRIPWTL